MLKLTDQMRREIDTTLEQGCAGVVATVSKDGVPTVGDKGSMMVFDDLAVIQFEMAPRWHDRCELATGAGRPGHGLAPARC
ncbi:hypothetical protein NKDENANG_04148 [Candidatus Entotheonellaceae bacterium PAL068K]